MSNENSTSVIPEQIAELLESRATYQEWLERLDQVGARYRTEVAERVKGDYETRLAEVAEELEGHRSDIEASLEKRRSEMEGLSSRFDEQSAELEEAELRFQVGEYDEDVWEGRREKLTEGLEEIDVALRDARKAVTELEGVLAELSGAPRTPVRDDPLPGLSGVAGSLDATPKADMPQWQRRDSKKRRRLSASQDVALEPEPAITPEPHHNGEAEPVSDGEAVTADVTETNVEAAVPADMEESVESEGDAGEEFSDELAFLESLSLDDTGSFDAVSRLLEEEEDR